MTNTIREPKQKRSIEKKERIIQAAYELFSDQGYYTTDTPSIAKKAGVSTGIVYGYFTDKRDILTYVLKRYINETASPIMDFFNSLSTNISPRELFNQILDLAESIHLKNANLHNILHSIAVVDNDINDAFLDLEKNITFSVSQRIEELNYNTDHLQEKVHIAMNIIQSYAHESIYDKHDYIDYAAMKTKVIDILVNLFK